MCNDFSNMSYRPGGSKSAGTSPNESRSGSPIPAEVKSKMTRSPLTVPKRKVLM